MHKTSYKDMNETIYHHRLKNGLNVYLLKKEGFHKTYATLSTNFGSLNTKVIEDQEYDLPQGIAHFLEHKLFEQKGEDVSKQFALQQASVNAYTQSNKTTYLFSCTDMFYDNLKLLLSFVLKPQFTKEGVDKEKKIITQEIKMYLDNPNTVVYMGILNNLFEDHPVTNEILGTIESINQIDVSILEKAHKAYYHPENMVLFITGNIEPLETIAFLDNECTTEFGSYQAQPQVVKEPLGIHKKEDYKEMDVLVPNYLMGLRIPETSKKHIMKYELEISVLLDLVLGKSTKAYSSLIEEGLINDSFGMDISVDESYGYVILGSETSHPDLLHKRLLDILTNIDVSSILEEDFLRTKKQTLGSYVHALNSLEFIASSFTKYHYQENNLFHLLHVSRDMKMNDLERVSLLFKNKDLYSRYTVYPKKNEE